MIEDLVVCETESQSLLDLGATHTASSWLPSPTVPKTTLGSQNHDIIGSPMGFVL